MARYRSKAVVNAVQFKNWNTAEIADFLGGSPVFGSDSNGNFVELRTADGIQKLPEGSWIVVDHRHKVAWHRDSTFKALYEPVDPTPPTIIPCNHPNCDSEAVFVFIPHYAPGPEDGRSYMCSDHAAEGLTIPSWADPERPWRWTVMTCECERELLAKRGGS